MTQQNPAFVPPTRPGPSTVAERLRHQGGTFTPPGTDALAAAAAKARAPEVVGKVVDYDGPEFDEVTEVNVTEVPDDVVTFTGTGANYRVRYGTITFAECEIDSRIQRGVLQGHVNKIAKEWNLRAAGQIIISVRVDENGRERFIVLDGQQRLNGGLRAGYKGPIRAEFHYDLTLEEEAELFRLHNNKRSVSTNVKFEASLHEGNASHAGRVANAIANTLLDLGIDRGPKGFNAVDMAVRIVEHNNGLTSFRWALEVCQETWKMKKGADPDYKPPIVEALALLYLTHGNMIDRDRMIRLLREATKDESTLIGAAKSRQTVHKGTLTPNMINEILNIYNKQLRESGGRRLPEWDVRQRTYRSVNS